MQPAGFFFLLLLTPPQDEVSVLLVSELTLANIAQTTTEATLAREGLNPLHVTTPTAAESQSCKKKKKTTTTTTKKSPPAGLIFMTHRREREAGGGGETRTEPGRLTWLQPDAGQTSSPNKNNKNKKRGGTNFHPLKKKKK